MNSTLPAPKVRVDQQRQPAELVDGVLVHGQHLAAGLGPQHRRIPLEAGQPLPDLGIVVLRVGQLGQQAGPAASRSARSGWACASPSRPAGPVSSTTGQRSPSSVSSSENSPSLHARHEDQAAGLKLDQPLDQPALLGRQLAVAHAHVAQEDDVVLRQLVEPGRETA